ncbi:hypothetical protein POM88_034060 [Heracleum sosnowskyi]|uniref:F-box domain-containing protein n=1 Tax=Heracleum sosnowskyi TaxID=360622 RepID=A0AAD8MD86_9APIA|nr:hypothetical protein POM88_034060 [Heracleum sosnowskyi]
MVKNGKTKKKYHKPTKPQHHSSPPAAQEDKPITVKTLPADLVLEILFRTPVKSLVRCNCVCKSWFALIHHPTFVKMHLDFNSSRKDKQLICRSPEQTLISLISLVKPPVILLNINKYFTDRPNYPRKINFTDFSKNMVLAGSVNGIVCLSHYEEMSERFVALWNPSIRYWKPVGLVGPKSWKNMSVGLGFDAVRKDYKIICIVPETRRENVVWSRIEIYSANKGSWENVDEKGIIPFWPRPDLRHCNFIVKGVPYWVGIDVGPGNEISSILGKIDPCTGLYKKVMYPHHVKNKSTWVHPVNMRDSVAAVIQFPGEYPSGMIDLYLLDENNNKWTKMYSIWPLSSGHVFERLRIPQCFSTGEIVIETWIGNENNSSDLFLGICDPRTNVVHHNNEIEELNPYWYESYSHVESLVCVKGMVQIGKEHKDKRDNLKTKNW